MKNLLAFFIPVLLFVSLQVSAQNKKDILDPCQSNDECRTGNCVVLRDGTKKCSSCNQDKSNHYTEEVDKWCKQENGQYTGYKDLKAYFGTGKPFSLIDLNKRMEICKACLAARQERERECWNGGDPGHLGEIEKMKDAINYLEGVENEARRNGQGFTCDEDQFGHLQEYKEERCRGLRELFERYGLNDGKEGNCSEINSLLDKCTYCRKTLEDMVHDCYRVGIPDKLRKELDDTRDMEKIVKETLDDKKSKNLCR